MKKTIFILITIIIALNICPRNLLSYDNNEFDVRIFYPDNYKKVLLSNGVIFYNDSASTAFSLLMAESQYPVSKHIKMIEENYDAFSILDSSSMYLTAAECSLFNVQNGMKSYFSYVNDEELVFKSVLALKRESIVYLIISEFAGSVDDEEVSILNDCIKTFRADFNE